MNEKIIIGPFPAKIESLNKKLGRHWRTRYRENKQFALLITPWVNCCDNKNKLTQAIKKKAVFYSSRKRFLDEDNLIGGFKGILDILVRLKIFVDDSPKWLVAEYEQVKGPDSFWIAVYI